MADNKINKGNPFGSPLLGEEVHVKDYTTGVVSKNEPVKQDASQPETVSNNQGTKIQNNEQLPPPPKTENLPPTPPKDESFGTDYEGDGVDDYVAPDINSEEEEQEIKQGEGVKMPEIDAELFSKIAVGGFKSYIPSLFAGLAAKISGVSQKDIDFQVNIKKLDSEYAELYRKDKAELKKELELTDEEAKLLQESLEAYLKYQSIEVANPANAFFLQAGMIAIRLTITSIQRGAEQRRRWNQLFKAKGITDHKNHSYEKIIKD